MKFKEGDFTIAVNTSNDSLTLQGPEQVSIGLFLNREGGTTADISLPNIYITLASEALQELINALSDPDKEIPISSKTFTISYLKDSNPLLTIKRDGISIILSISPEQYKALIGALLRVQYLLNTGDAQKILNEAKKG